MLLTRVGTEMRPYVGAIVVHASLSPPGPGIHPPFVQIISDPKDSTKSCQTNVLCSWQLCVILCYTFEVSYQIGSHFALDYQNRSK